MTFITLHYTDGREVVVNPEHITRYCDNFNSSYRCVNLFDDYIEVNETMQEISNLIREASHKIIK